MNITVYSNFSKKPNETKQPSGGRSVSVRLKESCSVINPVFILQCYNLSDNYVKWDNRYYYIDDITIIHNDIAEYSCSTDVLATYKNYIGSSSQYISRSATAFNTFIQDDYYPATAQKTIQSSSKANGFIFPESGAFVMGVQAASNGNSFGCTSYYVMDSYAAASVLDEIFNINNSGYNIAAVTDFPEEVMMTLINPQQYIVSCIFIPVDAESIGGSSSQPIKLGWYTIDGVSARTFNPSFDALPVITNSFTVPKHPQQARGVYLNNSPYSTYTLSYMPFGDIDIPADKLISTPTIYTEIIIDVITGQATLKVYAGSSNSAPLLASRSAKVGVDIAVSGGLYNYSPQDFLNMPSNIAKSVMSGGLAGNPFSEFAKIGEAMISPTLNTKGSNGALDFLEYDAKLYSTFTHVVNNDIAQHGRPLCEVRTVSSLSGYMQCLLPDLDVPATPSEKQEILDYMSRGFYYT